MCGQSARARHETLTRRVRARLLSCSGFPPPTARSSRSPSGRALRTATVGRRSNSPTSTEPTSIDHGLNTVRTPALQCAATDVTRDVAFWRQAPQTPLHARQWYKSRRTGLDREFADAIEGLVGRIVGSPLDFLPCTPKVSTCRPVGFPYAVYFRVSDDAIVVLGVHSRQDPSRWRTRP